ncbi:SGNH/GDSL hydrolase family protein [Candidatus Curtissbacteria bacterium]|nr:SGNH/GDSL hydrolase family protein [Candidatus Curtissbacteria bacterium]
MLNSSTILHFAKKLIIPLIIILPLSIVMSLVIAEKIIRFTSPQLTYNQAKNIALRVSHKSDFLPSDLKPNQETIHIGNTHEFTYPVKINSMGYRMEEFSKQKPQDEYRILMIGDSMTFGYGVQESYTIPSQLKASLNNYLAQQSIAGKKIQIVNAGFASGKAPDTYYLYLKKKGFELNPDLIIVNYFLNNDIADLDDNIWDEADNRSLPTKISSRTTEVEEDYTKLKREYQNWKFALPVLKNSHLWILFATTLELRSPETVAKIKKFLGVKDQLPLVQTLEVENCLFLNDCSPKMEELYNRYNTVVKATVDLAREKNVPIVVSLLPANPQVKEIATKETAQDENFYPQVRIRKLLGELMVDVIDPLTYVADANWPKYYFEKDGHPTQEGYTKLSQAFFDYLTRDWQIATKIR